MSRQTSSHVIEIGNLPALPGNTISGNTPTITWGVANAIAAGGTNAVLGSGGSMIIGGADLGNVGTVTWFTGQPVSARPIEISANSVSSVSYVLPAVSTLMSFDPDPKIEGTKIPIYRISALFDGGMTVDQIAEDFPTLSRHQIIEAIGYATAHPPVIENMYPKQSLKRLLRDSGFKSLEKAMRKKKKSRKHSATGGVRVHSGQKRTDHPRWQQERHERDAVVQQSG